MPQRYEREIDEILRRLDDYRPREALPRRLLRAIRVSLANRRLPFAVGASPSLLMGASVLLAALVYLLRAFAPALAGPAAVLTLVTFLGALALAVTRSRRGPARKWRGRQIDYPPGGDLVWAGWLRRWRDWRRGRRPGSRY